MRHFIPFNSDDHILSRMDDLRLMTHGSAHFTGEENLKGTIEKSKYADFVVLSKAFFSVDPEEIKNMESVLTVVNGEVVYGTDVITTKSRAS